MKKQQHKAIFIDKDGTLIPDIPYNVNPDLVTIEAATLEGIRLLHEQDYLLIVVSNQPGVGRGFFQESALVEVGKRISAILQEHGLAIDAFYYCPHDPDAGIGEYATGCDCRKPNPGMLLTAASDWDIDLKQSWMIGDILNDIEAGTRAGCRTILINNGNETEWNTKAPCRQPSAVVRDVAEAAAVIVRHVTHPAEVI